MIISIENDENNSGASNQVPVYRPKLNQIKRVTERKGSRSKSQENSKSPQGSRRVSSNDSSKNRPPKLG